MRRIERIIAQVRRLTDNEEFDNDPNNPLGITTQEIIEYLNDAQDNIQARITEVHPKVFISSSTIDLVANQELYALPAGVYLDGRLVHVETKFSEKAADYITLKQRHIKSRLPDVTSEVPTAYIRIGKQLAIQPIPARAWTNGLRLTYQKKLPNIGIRLGQVSAVQTSGAYTTRIDLNASPIKSQDSGLPTLAEHYIEQFDELSIVDKNGNITALALPVSSYDEVNGYITLEDAHTLGSAEAIAVGSYVVGGSNSTTHAELPDTCERYLTAYAAWKVLKADSMVDSKDQERELGAMMSEIISAFKEIDEDQMELELDEDWII